MVEFNSRHVAICHKIAVLFTPKSRDSPMGCLVSCGCIGKVENSYLPAEVCFALTCVMLCFCTRIGP